MSNVYNKLKEYQKNYPSLTFDNNGYEYIPIEIRESHKKQIKEISKILKDNIKGFVEFNNFKLRKNDTFSIRCQCYWDETFIGVSYIDIEDFK